VTHPQQPALVEQMLDWAEAQQHTAPAPTLRSLTAWAYTRDHTRTTLLEQRGYVLTYWGKTSPAL
jgi:hypothetical protein